MSTEDEMYDMPDPYDTHSSRRARRRSSGHGRRSRRRYDPYNNYQKSRRSKSWFHMSAPRLATIALFLVVIIYEFIILRGPVMKRGKASSQPPQTNNTSTVRTQVSRSEPNVALNHASDEEVQPADFDTSKASPTPSTSPVHAPVSPRDGETTAERIKAALEPLKEDKETPPYRPLKKNTHSDSLSGTSSKSKREPVKASDIEYQAADADETESSEKGKSNTSNYSSSSGKQDVDPPKQRKSLKRKEGGAEPGAGENFWQWFQETKGSEAGSSSKNLDCSADTLRLCQMFYKYLRKYKIRTVFDASCATNLNWLPAVLSKAGNELWGFKYYCSATDNEKMENSKQKLSKLSFIEYIGDEWWRDGFPEDTELLFAWDILPHVAYGRVWNFFVKAKKQDIKYILVDNYPGILNDPSPKRNYLNIRKHPFRFPSAKEVVQNVTEPGETSKRQLLFYEGSMLPDNLQ